MYINYALSGFVSPLPGGLSSPGAGIHDVSMPQLVWAAATVGSSSATPRLPEMSALELQWRTAMVRASFEVFGDLYERSGSYNRLDPAEKGAVSFFLGQAQAKVFANDFFRVSRFVHLDAYLAARGVPRSRSRPDFLGFHGRTVAIATEVKGRSNGRASADVPKAKNQATNIPPIAGHPTTAAYVHVAHFRRGEWCAYLEDPPQQRGAASVDPALLTLAYYQPIMSAIRGVDNTSRRIGDRSISYVSGHFPAADITVSILSDIAERLSTSKESPAQDRSSVYELYEWALYRDELEDAGDLPRVIPATDLAYLGDDGVLVELGDSWRTRGPRRGIETA